MEKAGPKVNKKDLFMKTIGIFSLLLAFFVILFTPIVIHSIHVQYSHLQNSEQTLVEIQKKYILWDFNKALDDLAYISSTFGFYHNPDLGESYSKDQQSVFLQLMKNRDIYDQIRFIDLEGMERVRVNYNNGSPSIVSSEGLQNKANRYYFSRTMELDANQVYQSPFDLNIEKGEIEIPHKPMIRFAVKYYKDQQLQGILVINYLGATIFEKMEDFSTLSGSRQLLVNSDGFWLKGVAQEEEWGFMFPLLENQRLKERFPEAADFIMNNNAGQIRTDEGLFTFQTIYPSREHGSRSISVVTHGLEGQDFFKNISYIDRKSLRKQLFARYNFFVHLFFVLIIILWLFARLLAQARVKDKQIKKWMVRTKLEAEKANNCKSTFLANMSHEIRTPIGAIVGYTELLENELQRQDLREYLNAIQSSSKSLMTIINDILDLSKVESGKLKLEFSSMLFSEVIRDINHIFSQSLKEKGLQFFIEIDPHIPDRLIFDRVRLQQILVNLINNAAKFTSQGYIRMNIKQKEIDEGHLELLINIEDTGIGIPADKIGKIFDTYEQAQHQNYTRFGGSGLGLSISRNLVELMQGTIEVESEVGKGTLFRIHFPDVEIDLNSGEQVVEKGLDKSMHFLPASILLVEDNADNRKMMRQILEKRNLNVREAVNGLQGLEHIERETPDLIIADCRMPEMGGLEMMEILKGKKAYSSIPIIAVTASSLEKESQLMEQKADSFLRKPINPRDLIRELSRFLPIE